MEFMYNPLANILFTFMTTGYVVLTAGLMFWMLLLGPKRKTKISGFSTGVALLARWR
jgi:hypothetical protein